MNDSWQCSDLGSILSVLRNGISKRQNKSGNGDQVSRIESISTGLFDRERVGYTPLTPDEKAKYQLQEGDILFSHINSAIHVGKSAIITAKDVEVPIYHGMNLLLMRSKSCVAPKYLYYYLHKLFTSGFWKVRCKQSVNQASVNQRDISAVPFCYPPLEEQERIVAILDEAFAAIDQAIANTEKNLLNATEIIKSEIDDLFVSPKVTWPSYPLGEVCRFQGGSQPPKAVFSSEKQDGYVRLIQIRDYKSDDYIVYIPIEKARRFCEKDDVMIGRYGPPLFQILRGIRGAYNVALMKAIPDESKLSKDFLFYFLKNRIILRYIENASSRAAGQTGIKKETLESYPISVPSLQMQSQIVKKLSQVENDSMQLAGTITSKIDSLKLLKQSLLADLLQ